MWGTVETIAGFPVVRWLDAEFKKPEERRIDLLGEAERPVSLDASLARYSIGEREAFCDRVIDATCIDDLLK